MRSVACLAMTVGIGRVVAQERCDLAHELAEISHWVAPKIAASQTLLIRVGTFAKSFIVKNPKYLLMAPVRAGA